jgi:hypothetical protein
MKVEVVLFENINKRWNENYECNVAIMLIALFIEV